METADSKSGREEKTMRKIEKRTEKTQETHK